MKICIGDRVRIKHRDVMFGMWGTITGELPQFAARAVKVYSVSLDHGGYTVLTIGEIEKLPRYRGYPQARDTKTAMRHLQEYRQ